MIMRRRLLVFLAMCAFTAAMIPRDKRALNTEEEEAVLKTQTSTDSTAKKREICAPQTPCAWSIYKPVVKYIEMKITNTYCDCANGTACIINEDDSSVNAYVHRCRLPPVEEENPES